MLQRGQFRFVGGDDGDVGFNGLKFLNDLQGQVTAVRHDAFQQRTGDRLGVFGCGMGRGGKEEHPEKSVRNKSVTRNKVSETKVSGTKVSPGKKCHQ
jgi:hypothetical protein